jgi:hypothetical protein
MDLNLYARVIWRFRALVLAGLLVAVALALLSLFRVTFKGGPTLHYRQSQTYQSSSTLLVTQTGFPWGRTVFPYTVQTSRTPGGGQSYTTQFADPSRFSDLALFYANLANSDSVQSLLRKSGPLHGTMFAQPVLTGPNSRPTPLPLISIVGASTSPAAAIETAQRGTTAFESYLSSQQQKAKIPSKQRVVVQLLNRATTADVVTKRKKTIAFVVFITVMLATLGLAFIFENLRPRVAPLPAVADADAQARRTA